MCAWVCYGDLQQNSISCLHLSRLIILCSISFKQETSHFLAVLWLYLAISKTVGLYCAAPFRWRHAYFPPCFNFLSQSFKIGPFNLLKGKVTCEDRAQHYFRSPFLPPLPPPTPPPPNKEREQGIRDLLISNFAADWVEKITPSDVVLLNYILQ